MRRASARRKWFAHSCPSGEPLRRDQTAGLRPLGSEHPARQPGRRFCLVGLFLFPPRTCRKLDRLGHASTRLGGVGGVSRCHPSAFPRGRANKRAFPAVGQVKVAFGPRRVRAVPPTRNPAPGPQEEHAPHIASCCSSGVSDRGGGASTLAARNAAGALTSRTRRRAATPRPPAVPPHAYALIAVGRLLACSLSSSGSGRSSVTRIPRIPSIPGVSSLPSRSGAPSRPGAPGRSDAPGRSSVSGRSRAPGRSGVTRIPRVPRIPGVSSLPGRSSLSDWCRGTSRARRTWWPLVASDKSQGKSKYHRAQPHNEGIRHPLVPSYRP
jgi:hypothetical protein